MKNKFLMGIMAIGIAFTLASCEKAPQADIDLAKASVDSARNVGAPAYKAEAFAALEDSLAGIMERVEVENGKWFPSFATIKTELEAVKTQAYQVVEQTEARKVEVQNEITALLGEIATLNTENKELVTKAPKGKEGKEALEQINTEIAAIDAAVVEANTQATAGDLLPALDKAKVAKENAASINAELKEVIAKTKR